MGELRPRPGGAAEQARERFGVDAVGLQLDRHAGAPPLAQREQRAVVGGALDDDLVLGRHEVLEQERVRLHRAVGDEHALGLHAVPVGDPGAQARVAHRRAVGGRAPGSLSNARTAASRRPSTSTMSSDGAPRAKEIVGPVAVAGVGPLGVATAE